MSRHLGAIVVKERAVINVILLENTSLVGQAKSINFT